MLLDPEFITRRLTSRVVLPELMDDPQLAETTHIQALRGLRRINLVSLTAYRFKSTLEALVEDSNLDRLRVLELACGSGDVLLDLEARMNGRSPRTITFDGCDINPRAVRIARALAAQRKSRSHFFTMNVADDPLPENYDVFISSLFLHHLSDEAIIELLKKMSEAANVGFVMTDLERSRIGLTVASAFVRFLSRSPVVHKDGVQSVLASFTRQELRGLAVAAGLKAFAITRCWPFRLLLVWRRGG